MKLHTMTAAAAVLVGLTGVAIAQQVIDVEKGMMVEGGEDFSYAGTWGQSGYARDLYQEAETAPATPATVMTVTRQAPAPATRQVTTTQASTPAVRYTVAPTHRSTHVTTTSATVAPMTRRTITTRSAPVRAPATSTLHVTSTPIQALPVTRSAPTVTTTRTITQPVQRIVRPAAPVTRAAPTQTRYPSTRAPQPLMRRIAADAPRNPIEDPVPNGDVGDCFARIMIPAKYNEVPDTFTVQEAYEGMAIEAAVFEDDYERIKVRDESIKYIVRQPKFRVEMERVVVKPAYERLHVSPAQWSYVNESVKISEPRLVWKAGTGLSGISRVDPKTGVTYCLVEEEGQTKRVQRRVMVSPERVSATMVPEQVVTVAHQVLINKGGVTEVIVPAQFREVPTQRLVRKANADRRQVAERTASITRRTLATPERFEWVPVLCDTNATQGTFVSIQRELGNRGYYNGALDGIFGRQSVAALAAFQKDRNITHAGLITLDTLKALNLGHISGHNAIRSGDALKTSAQGKLRGFQSAIFAAGQVSAGAIADAGADLARELAGGPNASPVGAVPAGPVPTNHRRRNGIVPAMDAGPSATGLGEISVEIAPATARTSTPVTSKPAPQAQKRAPEMRRRLTWVGRNN